MQIFMLLLLVIWSWFSSNNVVSHGNQLTDFEGERIFCFSGKENQN